MNVCFHILTAGGIAHVAAASLDARRVRGAQRHIGLTIPVVAALAALLSHGVLDGLKHGYPIRPMLDVAIGGMAGLAWCAAAHRRHVTLFAAVMLGSLAPDLIDLGPSLARSALGWEWLPATRLHLFPWHWPDGSGSMYPSGVRAPVGKGVLDLGTNRVVSAVNHVIISTLALTGVATYPGAVRATKRSG
jgi:hypothetical protein